MCGPENTLRPRGGALAVLHPSQNNASSEPDFNADLYLLTPGQPASDQATRAVLASSGSLGLSDLQKLHVFVSTTGDLTQRIEDCKTLCRFTFDDTSKSNFEAGFPKPISLQIGNEGIMGRRISLSSSPILSSKNLIAEGIVGHNFFSPSQQSRHSQAPF